MLIIEKYLELINKKVEEKESEGILPITACHMIYNHAYDFSFVFYGYESGIGYCGEEDALLLQLESHDIDQISRLFILGRLDEKNSNTHSGYCDVNDDSYIEAFEQRRPISLEEKVLYLNGLNTIFGSEDRIKLNNMFFKEKHSIKETIELLDILKKENAEKIVANQKELFRNCVSCENEYSKELHACDGCNVKQKSIKLELSNN